MLWTHFDQSEVTSLRRIKIIFNCFQQFYGHIMRPWPSKGINATYELHHVYTWTHCMRKFAATLKSKNVHIKDHMYLWKCQLWSYNVILGMFYQKSLPGHRIGYRKKTCTLLKKNHFHEDSHAQHSGIVWRVRTYMLHFSQRSWSTVSLEMNPRSWRRWNMSWAILHTHTRTHNTSVIRNS